ncbi:MAG: DUF4381 domain-containing protein [Dyella sp.]
MIAATADVPAAAPSGPVLRDIHLPLAPSWWPPAPGWWVLAALLLIALVAWGLWYRGRRRRQHQLARVLAELDGLLLHYRQHGDAPRLAAGLHQLLRRAARRLDPAAAQQQGAAWQATLARVALPAPMQAQLLALEQQMYRNDQSIDATASALAVRRWIERSWRQAPTSDSLHTRRSARHG